MNPEEQREFRDDVDEESWVDTGVRKLEVIHEKTLEETMKEFSNVTRDLAIAIKSLDESQQNLLVSLKRLKRNLTSTLISPFENQAAEDLEVLAMKEAEIKKY